ncbi:SAM-dependent methyltransferase, partial [Burkholderia pseudomallei]
MLGAGPGDLDLLTMKAAKALAAADVLLLDDLVDPGIVA